MTVDSVLHKDGAVTASTITSTGSILVDTILEYTSGAGVNVDGILHKDTTISNNASGTDMVLFTTASDMYQYTSSANDRIIFGDTAGGTKGPKEIQHYITYSNVTTNNPSYNFYRSGGSLSATGAGDYLSQIRSYGYDGSAWQQSTEIRTEPINAMSSDLQSSMTFSIHNGSAIDRRLVINKDRVEVQFAQLNFYNASGDPSDGIAGDVYYNTGSKVLRFHNGTTWADV